MEFVCNTVVPYSCLMLFEMSLQKGCHTRVLNTGYISRLFSLCLAVGRIVHQHRLPFLRSCRGSWLYAKDTHCSHGLASMSAKVSTSSPSSYIWSWPLFLPVKSDTSLMILILMPTKILQHAQYNCIYACKVKVRSSSVFSALLIWYKYILPQACLGHEPHS